MGTATDFACRIAATCVGTIGVLATAACLSNPLVATKDLPRNQAAPQINATLIHPRVPPSFLPLAATEATSTWGAQARTVTAAFTTNRAAFDQFMTTITVHRDPTWMKDTASSSCPPDDDPPPTQPAATEPNPLSKDWYDRGILQHCKAIESWAIASTEFKDTARSAGHIYAQTSATDTGELTVLIGTTIT